MQTIEELKRQYTPIVQDLIDSNIKFYGFNHKIEWEFFANENTAIFGSSKQDLKLYINIYSVIHSYELNEPLQIEYFILHEIRHIYQRLSVLINKQNDNNNEMAKQWDYEFTHYIKPNENVIDYYNQHIEFDAFTYAYSIMIYKYNKISYIDYPRYYHSFNDFDIVVNNWINIFKNQNL